MKAGTFVVKHGVEIGGMFFRMVRSAYINAYAREKNREPALFLRWKADINQD